jgi:hypothetical protein
MGMFDRIICEYPLPDAGANAIPFQTKDLECQLRTYRITESGRLLAKNYMCQNADTWDDTKYHGILRFYGDKHSGQLRCININTGEDSLHPGPDPEWFEYVGKFTDGTLVEVKRVTT